VGIARVAACSIFSSYCRMYEFLVSKDSQHIWYLVLVLERSYGFEEVA